MVCIYCGTDTRVINSRLQKRLNQVWRRRQCQDCGAVFSSHETASYEDAWRLQAADGSLRPFSRDKLFLSLYDSCRHRPDAVADAGELTRTIIGRLRPEISDGLVAPGLIVRSVLSVLDNYDAAAAVHYRAFHD